MSGTSPVAHLQLVSHHLEGRQLDIGPADVLVSLLTFVASLTVLIFAANPIVVDIRTFIGLHLAVLLVPLIFWAVRLFRKGDLTIPVLLMLTSFAAGPVGAVGCAGMALALRYQRPSPVRLQDWYDYIAGVVTRAPIVQVYEELSSGRLPPDPVAKVPRFRPILHGTSLDEQQRVLGVIGRRYHADFRSALRHALRNKNSFIRAQAAAVASRLDGEEKTRLWSSGQPPGTTSAG